MLGFQRRVGNWRGAREMIKGIKKRGNKAFPHTLLGVSHVPFVPCAGLQNGPPAAGL